MKKLSVIVGLLAMTLPARQGSLLGTTAFAATQKHVSGIITSVDPASVCITSMQGGNKVVTGRIDTARTKVLVDGHAARPADLQVTYSARAELGLDDVWLNIQADTAKSFHR